MTGQHDQPALPETADNAREETTRPLPGRGADRTPGEAVQPGHRHIDHQHIDQRPRHPVQEQLIERMWRLPPGHPSSPYDSYGRLRPPVPDVRQFELPLPGEEDYDEVQPGEAPEKPPPAEAKEEQALANERTRPPESADREADSSQETSLSWRNALPSLRDIWQKHQDKWPENERPSVDRSGDEPGSWRGDSGHYLNAEENLVSDHAKARIGDVEKKATPALLEIAAAVPGAGMAGLDSRLKGDERFKEKVTVELRAKPERSVAEISERMPDALRYTYQIESSRYVDGYWRARGLLEQRGNELVMSRNSWDDPEYKGINTRWISAEGQVFEVQFHTQESYEAKQLTHRAYERLRSKMTSPAERPDLEAFQREVSSHIPMPEGAAEIPDYRKEGY